MLPTGGGEGVGEGNGGTVLISSWECNYSIYLDIQAIANLLCLPFYWFLMCNYTCFYNTCSHKPPLLWKVMFQVTSKPTPPTVFNLQASDWVHCEEEIGASHQSPRNTYKLVIFCLPIFKVVYFHRKEYSHFKKFHKIYYSYFFQKRDNWAYVYMY